VNEAPRFARQMPPTRLAVRWVSERLSRSRTTTSAKLKSFAFPSFARCAEPACCSSATASPRIYRVRAEHACGVVPTPSRFGDAVSDRIQVRPKTAKSKAHRCLASPRSVDLSSQFCDRTRHRCCNPPGSTRPIGMKRSICPLQWCKYQLLRQPENRTVLHVWPR